MIKTILECSPVLLIPSFYVLTDQHTWPRDILDPSDTG